MQHGQQQRWMTGLVIAVVALELLSVHSSGWAQDATPSPAVSATFPPRAAVMRYGTCSEPGDVVATLPNLTLPRGARVGQASLALLAQSARAQVPLPMTTLLLQPTVIEVHHSPREPEVVIACGEVGGTIDSAGDLTIGLRAMGDDGVMAMAQLHPSADGAETEIAVFVAVEVGRGQRRATTSAASGGTGAAVRPALDALATPLATPRS